MRKLPWAALGLFVMSGFGGVIFSACGSESTDEPVVEADAGNEGSVDTDTGGGGDTGVDAGGRADAADCRLTAQSCTKSTECCSLNCNATTLQCDKPVNDCTAPGAACTVSTECCTLSCIGSKCSWKLCVADNQGCGANEECCGGLCTTGTCTPLNGPGPSTSGNPCTTNADCSSKYCANGVCTSPSFCVQTDDVCSTNNECCSGVCTIGAGVTVGKCGPPAAAPGATECLSAGIVCGTGTISGTLPTCGGACCSRSCGPSSVSGILVCQPSSGCHPTGELCRSDSDCCGWSGSPDPKQGFVHCSKAVQTQEFGRCDNGGACREPGSICKPADYSCSAENNCCDPVAENSSYCNSNPENCCHRDALGIPRCLIKPVDCTSNPPPAGTTCATSADCCGKPCVNNVCSGTCIPATGGCTTNADCCTGLPCAIPPGATKGVCGGTVLPDGGISNEGGTVTSDGGVCALYGQTCADSSECCSGVPCTNGTCHYP